MTGRAIDSHAAIHHAELAAVDWEHHIHVIIGGRALCESQGPWPSVYRTASEKWLCPKCSARQPYLNGFIGKAWEGPPDHFEAAGSES